ncbi:hypothetical protein BC629DRAFT_1591094 [Irpex lacteus]|nr:hypothetical protein BC629DRAFT_1591094 [Irpex lacteus]
MASPNHNPAQTRIMTIVSCIALAILSVAALGFVIWGVRRIIARARQRKTLSDTESGRGSTRRNGLDGKEDMGSTVTPSSGDIDPFQTPAESQVNDVNPPEWAVQYQRYLESRNKLKKTSSAASTKSSHQGRAPSPNAYPRGLGILMDPEDAAYLADNEGAVSSSSPLIVGHQDSRNKRTSPGASVPRHVQRKSPASSVTSQAPSTTGGKQYNLNVNPPRSKYPHQRAAV